MAQAEHARSSAPVVVEQQDLAPSVAAQIAEPVRQILDTGDVQKIAAFLNGYGGDLALYLRYLQERYGNAFCAEVVAEQQKPAAPSAWDKLRTDGKLRLFEAKKAADPEKQTEAKAEEEASPAANSNEVAPALAGAKDLATKVAGDKQFDLGSKSVGTGGKLAEHHKDIEHSHGKTSIDSKVADTSVSGTGSAKANAATGVDLAGNADAKAHLVGTTVAIHSKPFTHELFGEQVTAQFALGVSAHTYAEAKGNLGVNVGWSGLAAKAELTGTGNGNAELTGSATLSWAKKSPAMYAAQLASNGAWKQILGRYLPGWALRALPESRVQGWIQSLIELVISGSGGDQLVLGASTSATARASLGLPGLSFKGGSLGVKPGAGLSFGGADASLDVELGKDAGMELLTMLAFGGGTALFNKLAPNFSISKFLEEKLDTSLGKDDDKDKDGDGEQAGNDDSFRSKMVALRDKAKSLDGTHSFAWNKGEQKGADDVRAEGSDFTFTKDKSGSKLRTGDDARQHDEHQTQAMTASEKQPGKLQKLAEKLGDTQVSVAKTSHHYSKTAIDKKTKELEVAGMKGELSGRALELEGNATGEVKAGAKGISVAGNAGASAYLMGGQVHIETPNLPFTVFGEQLVGKVDISADAGAFAQVQGNVGLDVGWSGAGMQANLSGFAGVKAGITAAGSLHWSRKPASYYTDQIVKTGAWKGLFGSWLPQWVLNRAPDKHVRNWINNLIEMLVNGSGDALVLGAIARGEGSAGIGAAASFSAKFQGGVLHCHGRGGITFGLGAGAAVDLSLGVTDGMAMLGVMALRGGTELFQMLQPSMNMMSYLKPLFAQMRNRDADEPKKKLT